MRGKAATIELKYPTRKLTTEVNGETFRLVDGAADYTLYDYIKDIERLEQITQLKANTVVYAVMLTNDGSHWTASPNSSGADYRLPEGWQIAGSITWGPGASPGSTKGHERPLTPAGSYAVHWQDYSRVDATARGTFRYLVTRVPAGDVHT